MPDSDLKEREQTPSDVESLEKEFGGDFSAQEKSRLDDLSNRLGQTNGLYKPGSDDTKTKKPRFSRRQKAAGGGVVGVIIGAGAFFSVIGSGPLQFIHFAQQLTRFHFASQSEAQDDRVIKQVRYLYFASKGTAERSRLGVVGNRYADRFEAKLNASGVATNYKGTTAFIDAYSIDRTHPNYRGRGDVDIKAEFKEKYGIIITTDAQQKLVIDVKANKLNTYRGYFKNKLLLKSMMRQAGYTKVSSSIGARLSAKRAGLTLHPIRKIDNKITQSADERLAKWRKNRASSIKNGAPTVSTTTTPDGEQTPQEEKDRKAARKAAADGTLAEGRDAAAGASEGKPGAIEGFKSSVGGKVALSGAAAIGVFCIAKAIAANADSIKQQQVVLPLMRIGFEMIAVGNQVMSGQDIDLEQLGYYVKLLHQKEQKNADGSVTPASNFNEADSYRTESGEQPLGYRSGQPDDTLKTISDGTPFDFLNEGAQGATLRGFCDTVVGQVGLAAIGFLSGPVGFAVGTVVSAALLPIFISNIASWIAGDAVNPFVAGAPFGNNANFGARLAANLQSILGGGKALTTQQSSILKSNTEQSYQYEFSQKSFAYRMFNVEDHQSFIAQVIDRQNPNQQQNVASLAGRILNIPKSLGSLSSGFFKPVAAESGYDYGFPKFGFSADELESEAVANPYLNAEAVTNLLDDEKVGPGIIDKAKKCFGVSIQKDSESKWNVISQEGDVPTYKDIEKNNCADSSEQWTRVRFFILDTETMNSMACYEGDEMACSEFGLGSQGSTTVTPGGVTEDVKALAQRILANPNVTYPLDASSPNGSSKAVLQAIAKGEKAPVACGNAPSPTTDISPNVLKFLAELGEQRKIGINAITDKCHSSPSSNHYTGMAVDFECNAVPFDVTAGDAVAQKYGGTHNSETCAGERHWHYDFK